MEASRKLVITLSIVLLSTCSIISTTMAASRPKSLDFYMYIAVQNLTYVTNPAPFTALLSAAPVNQSLQPFAFGEIHTFDNPLTSKPYSLDLVDRVGQVQGWYGNTGQFNLTLFLVQTFVINTTSNQGTLSLLGLDFANDVIKYAPIVGGTGDFSFARGVAAQNLLNTSIVDDRTVSWFHYNIRLKY